MTPYYDKDGITIFCGDCREILPTLGPVDLVLTDPPYGIGDAAFATDKERRGARVGGSNNWHPASDWDKELCLPELSAPLIAWFGHWRKRGEVEAVYGRALCELIWFKDMHCGPPCPAARQDERIWLFGKPFKPLKFETTVWQVPVIPTWSHKHHKNEKPLPLMSRLIAWLPGETILDPFMGSGTTLRAAKDLGRRAIGIEIEERYCEIAVQRLRQEVLFLKTDTWAEETRLRAENERLREFAREVYRLAKRGGVKLPARVHGVAGTYLGERKAN